MATTAPDTVERVNHGPVEVGTAELDGYSATFLHVLHEVDMTRMLRGLPGDVCPCPHWGVVTEGRMVVRYADHEEVVGAGDVFYMPPNHIPVYAPGTHLIFFSPSEELKQVDDAIARNQRELQSS
jgi:hypothetical protein